MVQYIYVMYIDDIYIYIHDIYVYMMIIYTYSMYIHIFIYLMSLHNIIKRHIVNYRMKRHITIID